MLHFSNDVMPYLCNLGNLVGLVRALPGVLYFSFFVVHHSCFSMHGLVYTFIDIGRTKSTPLKLASLLSMDA